MLDRQLGRGARRLVRDLEQLRLPALLLELPRHERRKGSTATSSSRTRSRPTTCSARRTPGRRTSGDPAEREAGLVVALDVKSGTHRPIYGMGRHNHENSVAIPGYGKPVVLSGDDTFTSGPLTDALDTAQKLGAVPVAALLLHRAEHEGAAGRQGRPLGLRLGHAGGEELLRRRSPDRARRSPAISSRCRGTSRPASTPTARS